MGTAAAAAATAAKGEGGGGGTEQLLRSSITNPNSVKSLQLGLLDWGQTKTLSPELKYRLARLIVAMYELEESHGIHLIALNDKKKREREDKDKEKRMEKGMEKG